MDILNASAAFRLQLQQVAKSDLCIIDLPDYNEQDYDSQKLEAGSCHADTGDCHADSAAAVQGHPH